MQPLDRDKVRFRRDAVAIWKGSPEQRAGYDEQRARMRVLREASRVPAAPRIPRLWNA